MARQHLGASPVPPARAPSQHGLHLHRDGHPQPRPPSPRPPPALTALQDAAEEALPPLQGAAVPAVPPELVLALGRPGGHAAPDGQHGLGVPPAQLPLPAHQPRHVVAHHPRRSHGPHVPAGGNGRGSDGSTRPEPPRARGHREGRGEGWGRDAAGTAGQSGGEGPRLGRAAPLCSPRLRPRLRTHFLGRKPLKTSRAVFCLITSGVQA